MEEEVHDESVFNRVGDTGAAGNADEAKGDVKDKIMLRLVEMARRVLVVLRPMMDTIVIDLLSKIFLWDSLPQTYRRLNRHKNHHNLPTC